MKEVKTKEQIKRKLEKEREQEEVNKWIKKAEQREKLADLAKTEKKLIEHDDAAHHLLNDTNEKLQLAILQKDMNGVKVAQMMFTSANENIKNISSKLSVIRDNIAKIRIN